MIEFTVRLRKMLIKIEKVLNNKNFPRKYRYFITFKYYVLKILNFYYQELQKEIDNHNLAYSNLNTQSQKIIDSYKRQIEKEALQKRIDELNTRWIILRKKSLEIRYKKPFKQLSVNIRLFSCFLIRSRLESNSSQWTALLSSLNELIIWCRNQANQIELRKQYVQADPNVIQKQINEFKVKKENESLFRQIIIIKYI